MPRVLLFITQSSTLLVIESVRLIQRTNLQFQELLEIKNHLRYTCTKPKCQDTYLGGS